MLAAVEHRFGLVNRLPVTIEWLSDNGSCYIAGCAAIDAHAPRLHLSSRFFELTGFP